MRAGGRGAAGFAGGGEQAMKIYLPPCGKRENYEQTLTELGAKVCGCQPLLCDALLLPGGADLDPALYGCENTASRGVSRRRDGQELRLFNAFMKRQRPILGICRGQQLINVALGGTLLQDIPEHGKLGGSDRLHLTRTQDETLCALYGERFLVNSAHHQAVDRLGEGLRAVQWAEDGTVEALRHETLPIFAVQWHPERMHAPTDGRKLFARWLQSVEERKRKRG